MKTAKKPFHQVAKARSALFYLMILMALFGNLRVGAQIPMPDRVCQGETKHYWVDPTPGSTYTWQIDGIIQASVTNEIYVTWDNPFGPTGSPHIIAVQEKSNAGCKGDLKSGLVYVNALPTPTISGPASVCINSTGNIYATESGMTNYTWTISAGGTITAGTGTNKITVTWNGVGPQKVTVNYTNVNGCKAVTATTYNVTVNPLPVPTIIGPASVCVGTSGNTYSTQPGMTGYTWVISPGGTITAGGTSTSSTLTVTWNVTGAQTVKVNYTNGNGCTAIQPASYGVTVQPLPVPTITGPSTVCVGSIQNTYTTQAGMANYVWSVSAGGTITAGGTSTSNFVTVTWNLAGAQSVSVNYANVYGCTAVSPKSFPVTVNPRPVPTITGPSSVCVGSSGNVYTTESGMTGYTWTVSAGGTITSGTGTRAITVTWSTTGAKTVKVTYSNGFGCFAITPTTYNVMVNPRPTPSITGPNSVCNNSSGNIYSTQTGMTGYTWTISGGTITAGATTSSITVTWTTAGTQFVKVNYNNAFGCPANAPTQYNVTVKSNPVPTITGVGSICINNSASYITEAGMTGYTWTVSPGNTIVSGQGTRLVTVKWNVAGTQTVSVLYNSPGACPVIVPTVKTISVNPLPVPTITGPSSVCVNALVNFSTEAGMTNYTWFIGGTGGVIISGAASREITAKWTLPGAKYIQVNYTNQYGCRASASTNKNVTTFACKDSLVAEVVNVPQSTSFQVYPNPNNGLFTTSIDCFCEQSCYIEVYDLLGKRLYHSGNLLINGKIEHTIDLRGAPPGMYSVVFRNDTRVISKNVIITQ